MKITFSAFKNTHSIPQLLLSSLFINLLSLSLPFAMLQIYDRILPNQSHGTAVVLVIGVSIAIILETFLRYARSWLLASSAADFELGTTINVVKKLMNTKHDSLEKLGTGNILNGINSISSMRDLYSGQAFVSLMDVPFVFIFLALVAYIGGWLVLIPIVVWCAVFLLVFAISKTLFEITKSHSNADAEHSRLLIGILSEVLEVKAYAFENKFTSEYKESNYKRLKLQEQVDWLSAKLQELIQGASQATTLILVLVGALAVLNGSLTTGGLVACSILAGRAVAPLSAIINLRSRYVAAQSALKNVSLLMDAPEEMFSGQKSYGHKLPHGPICFENVSVETMGAKIEDLSFEIKTGNLVNIFSSPITDANLVLSSLAHFNGIDDGEITIDGIEIGEHCSNEFKQSVLYISAWPKMFSGTVLENMTMFRPELEYEALALAELLGLNENISRLPAGYSTTIVDNGGHTLNYGTQKLVGLIRGIVQQPSILLLSEPLMSLDVAAQNKLLSLIKSLKGAMTIVMVNQFEGFTELADLQVTLNRKTSEHSFKLAGDK